MNVLLIPHPIDWRKPPPPPSSIFFFQNYLLLFAWSLQNPRNGDQWDHWLVTSMFILWVGWRRFLSNALKKGECLTVGENAENNDDFSRSSFLRGVVLIITLRFSTKIPEMEYMKIQFRWCFLAKSWDFSDLRFLPSFCLSTKCYSWKQTCVFFIDL